MFTSQLQTRRSRSLSPVRSPRHVVPRRNRSLGRKPVPVGAKRSYDEAFFDDDDDDDWIFHPALDPYRETFPSTGSSLDGPPSPPGGVMVGGAPPEPLLDFEMHPVGPRPIPRTTWDGRLSTSVVAANAPSVNNRFTSRLTNVTSSAFQKRRMIPK